MVSIIIWSWKENFPLPHENFSQLFVITPPVFLSLFSKKYTGSWRANWLQALSSCQKVYEARRDLYQSGKSEMFDEMAILFSLPSREQLPYLLISEIKIAVPLPWCLRLPLPSPVSNMCYNPPPSLTRGKYVKTGANIGIQEERSCVSVSVSGLNGLCSGYGVSFIIIGWSSSCVWWKTVPIELWQVNLIQFLPAASDRRRGQSQQMLETQSRASWETIRWMDLRTACLRLTFAVTAENNGTIKSCNNVTRWVHLVILNNFRWECKYTNRSRMSSKSDRLKHMNCKNRNTVDCRCALEQWGWI